MEPWDDQYNWNTSPSLLTSSLSILSSSSPLLSSSSSFDMDYFDQLTPPQTPQPDSPNQITDLAQTIALSILLGSLIVATIIGNVFVIIAILMEKNLRTVGNYLVLSLAIADLMVACLVMPLGAVYEVSGEWKLGSQWCDIWTSADVLCCTASILHLLAIAIDRYWAVTNIDYIHNRNPNRICSLIVCIWTVASIISIAPILGWKDADFERRLQADKKCLVSQDVGYQVVATFATFYGPLVFILLLYWRIYQVARTRIRRRPGNRIVLNVQSKATTPNADNNNCETTKSLSVPFNVEVTTTNLSSDMSTNTTVTTTTTSAPSPEKSNNGKQQTTTLSTCPGAHSAPTLLTCPDSVSPTTSESKEELQNTSPMRDQLQVTPPTAIRSNSASPTTIIIEKDRFSSDVYESSTIDIDDDWNLINQEISVTSDIIVTCNSRGTNHITLPSPKNCINGPKSTKVVRKKMLKIPNSPSLNRSKGTNNRNYGTCRPSSSASGNGRDSIESKRERKAAKTLAIITGIFVVCWLPFFIVALLLPLCGPECHPPALINSLFQWLGYVNSMLNPVIYTIFSADFRTAFKKIIYGKRAVQRMQNKRL